MPPAIPQKIAAVSEADRNFSYLSLSDRFSPYQGLCLVAIPEIPRHLGKNTLPFAPAGSFGTGLGRDHRNDADDLRLRCKSAWIEAIGRPGKIVVHAVEAHAEQMLDPLGVTPSVPAGRLVGPGDRRQAR